MGRDGVIDTVGGWDESRGDTRGKHSDVSMLRFVRCEGGRRIGIAHHERRA